MQVPRPVAMTDTGNALCSVAAKTSPYDLLRPDFGSPEAVQSFLLQAYRPPDLPKATSMHSEGLARLSTSLHN